MPAAAGGRRASPVGGDAWLYRASLNGRIRALVDPPLRHHSIAHPFNSSIDCVVW